MAVAESEMRVSSGTSTLKITVETTDGDTSEFTVKPGVDYWRAENGVFVVNLKASRATYNFPFTTLRCFIIEPTED